MALILRIMREIKFRGKSDLGVWKYGALNNVLNWADFIIEHWEGAGISTRVTSNTIGQFTGLKDKKGNDIYEGDILDTGWEISFKDGMFGVFDKNNYMGFNSYMSQHREVIGNIHENPALLAVPTAVL